MKPATIGTLIACSMILLADSSVSAAPYRTTSQYSDVLQINHKSRLGAPLYAGSSVIIIERGDGRHRHGYNRRGNRHNPYAHPRHRGHRYDRGHRGPRYGRHAPRYNPYPYWSYGYDRRYPWPRYGSDPRYGRGYDRGYDRGYGRERYDRGPRLTILGATYRSVDGRACSAFSHVHKRCDGERSCSVKASNSICGDPDRGRLKILEVAYACGNQERRARVPEKSRSQLRCR